MIQLFRAFNGQKLVPIVFKETNMVLKCEKRSATIFVKPVTAHRFGDERTEPRLKYFASVFSSFGPDQYSVLTQSYTDCGVKETTEI